MNTKIVYILTSTPEDIYLEQAYVSMYSLRKYNPDTHIVLLTDDGTYKNITSDINRKKYVKEVNEFIPIVFKEDICSRDRSRWLKTNMREYIKGDFLFIDTDTVICSDLSEIDKWNFSVGAVLDLHVPFNKHPYEQNIRGKIKKMYNMEIPKNINYYNSGVMFVKDDENATAFFKRWHEIWKSTRLLPKGFRDQQSLIKTEIDYNGFITSISGDYNCQVLGSIQYLHTAKIVHFFNTQWCNCILSPLFDKQFYYKIKNNGFIDDEQRLIIEHCKSSFISPSMPIGHDDMVIWCSSYFRNLRSSMQSPTLNMPIKAILKCASYLTSKLSGGEIEDNKIFLLQPITERRAA